MHGKNNTNFRTPISRSYDSGQLGGCKISKCGKIIHDYGVCAVHFLKAYQLLTLSEQVEYTENDSFIKRFNQFCFNRRPERRYQLLIMRHKKFSSGLPLTLEQYVILIQNPCYYCSILTKSGIGLDRIENNTGYTINNVISCCGLCNSLRSNLMTVEETKKVITTLQECRGRMDIWNETSYSKLRRNNKQEREALMTKPTHRGFRIIGKCV